MRSTLLLGVLAACGSSPGLLLDVHGSKDLPIAKVEVFVPDAMHESGMGMPPMQSPKTMGTVYPVIANVTADASGNAATILLQAGSTEQVPALLVLGYDGNHDAVGYALITDPKGPLDLRTTQRIVVDLDPITEVTVDESRKKATSTRLARWSAQQVDANDGPCVALIAPDGTGDFFGPKGDKDCDAAMPECDDTWFLHSVGAGRCATQTPPATETTQDACRIGNTPGCTDNVAKDGMCVDDTPAVCTPVTLCEQCQSVIDTSCLTSAVNDARTMSIQCVIYIDAAAGTPLMCPGTRSSVVDMTANFGDPWVCNGLAGFAGYLDTTNLGSMPLQSTSDVLNPSCHIGTTMFSFEVAGTSDSVDPQMMPTTGTLVVAAQPGQVATPTRYLAMPFQATFQPVTPCPTEPVACDFVPGFDNGQPFDDPMWHCVGR